MSLQVSGSPSGMIDAYRSRSGIGAHDELLDGLNGPHHERVATMIEASGLAGLLTARAETRTFVADEGVTYGSAAARNSRMWTIDPLPVVIDPQEWAGIARGLSQRFRLLDAILTDLYTDRTLLRRGILPAAVTLGHPGFLRAADGLPQVGGRHLLLGASDLGRDSDGAWKVISDRTDAPSGAGYAMITRRIVSRVVAGLHRSSDLIRLRGFFHTVTAALMDAAPRQIETPRVVVLSAGEDSEAAFDTSFLATMLGFDVAEADDLLTHRGRPWLRAGDRLEPVDVILRRVDGAMVDPLELRGHSQIGLPGLVEAHRNGRVRMANPVGSGVLDNPGLLAHLPALAREVLGEDLLLDSPFTWWCGDPASLSHVSARLDSLVVKQIARRAGSIRYGWLLSAGEAEDLRARILAEPWAWAAQEPIGLSTAPVITSTGLEPRRLVLRGFGVAVDEDYHLLPGGLGRVTSSTTEYTVSNRVGMLAKDIWIPSAADAAAGGPAIRPRLAVSVPARVAQVTPRVAGTLMSIGRHSDRAESMARLLKVTDDLFEDYGSRPGTPGAAALTTMTAAVRRITDVDRSPVESGGAYLRRMTLDASTPGSVAYSAGLLVSRSQQVRDLMSVDAWSVFARLERTLAEAPGNDQALQPLLENVLESMLAFAGIMAQSMVRDSSWAFLDAGGRLARARHTLNLLQATMSVEAPPEAEEILAEAVLRACESIITHRRRAASGTGPAEARESAISLLLTDLANPRSLAHQVEALAADLRLVGDDSLASEVEGMLARLLQDRPADVLTWLGRLLEQIGQLEQRIAQRHFVRQATRHTAGGTWTTPGRRS